MKSRYLTSAFLALCFTSCASSEVAFTGSQMNQIRPGVTTEAELVGLFGQPDTKLTTFAGSSSIAWFRSPGPPISGYLPIVGVCAGGLDLNVQELHVLTGIGGRVISFSLYQSMGEVKTEQRLAAYRIANYGK